jgi:predicted O-methyltransferase YrrM
VSATAPETDFAATLARLNGVEGWLSDEQARRLWDAALRVPAGGRIVEIGSFRGRSAIVLGRAAPPDTEVVAIDPHGGGDRGPQEITPDQARGDEDHAAFHRNLATGGVADRVRHVRLPSADALGEVGDPIDLLYVDGAHRYVPARDDIARWGARVSPGGSMLIHDSFSAVGVTLAQLRLLVPSSEWRYAGRERTLAEYRRETAPLTGAARRANASRQLAELPSFARTELIKLALLAHAPGVARRLGHDGSPWPY